MNDFKQNRDGRPPPKLFKKNLSEVKVDICKIKELLLKDLKKGDNVTIKQTYDMLDELYIAEADLDPEHNSESENEGLNFMKGIKGFVTRKCNFCS